MNRSRLVGVTLLYLSSEVAANPAAPPPPAVPSPLTVAPPVVPAVVTAAPVIPVPAADAHGTVAAPSEFELAVADDEMEGTAAHLPAPTEGHLPVAAVVAAAEEEEAEHGGETGHGQYEAGHGKYGHEIEEALHGEYGEDDGYGYEGKGHGIVKGVSNVDVSISVMLVGGVTMVMVLYEFTNCKNTLFRQMTWKVLNATISIFGSILVFQSFEAILIRHFYSLLGEPEHGYHGAGGCKSVGPILGRLFVSLTFFFALQIALGLICGAFDDKPGSDDEKEETQEELQEGEESTLSRATRKAVTLGGLLGHITGFAFISTVLHVQDYVYNMYSTNVWLLMLIPFICWYFMVVLCRATEYFRDKYTMLDDHQTRFEKLWEEAAEETEDDAMALMVSFCLVQVWRYGISGVWPGAEGHADAKVLAHLQHLRWKSFQLVLPAFIMLLFDAFASHILKIWLEKQLQKGAGKLGASSLHPHLNAMLKREAHQFKLISAMTLSWAMLFASYWLISRTLAQQKEVMMKKMVLCCWVTSIGFVIIVLLVFVGQKLQNESTRLAKASTKNKNDLEALDKSPTTALGHFHSVHTLVEKRGNAIIRAMVMGSGLFIGFAWEKAFYSADVKMSYPLARWLLLGAKGEEWVRLATAILVCLLVVPSQYRHITKRIIEYKEQEEKEEHEEIELFHQQLEKQGLLNKEEARAEILENQRSQSGDDSDSSL